MRRFYRVGTDALPRWIPRVIVTPYGYLWLRGDNRTDLLSGYRALGPCTDRDATVFVPARWYWYAKLELFLQSCLYFVLSNMVHFGVLVGPEGGYYTEFRFNHPSGWRW